MKIKWTFVQNQDISVLAQQIETKQGTVTFRPWNPKYIEDDHVPEPEVSCPVFCICCFLVECCFKNAFKEHIDDLDLGLKDAGTMFGEMIDKNSGEVTMVRWLSWQMSFIGHCLLFQPMLRWISWIPFVGWLLSAVLGFVILVFSLVWSTMLHFLILTVAWIVYRPLYGLAMACCAGVCLYIIYCNPPAADFDTNQALIDGGYIEAE